MAGFGDLVQKAFYLGVGMASYAGEKAGTKLSELRVQAQKLADEMVARGEINAEEARRMVDEMLKRAQEPPQENPTEPQREPRRIEILDADDVTDEEAQKVDELRRQVESLQQELRQLKRD